MNELLSLFTQKILKDNDTKSARYAIGVLAECMQELEVAEESKPLSIDTNKASGVQTSPPYTYTHGQKFKAEICGTECEGKVSIGASGNIYLCQDKKIDTDIAEKFGHLHDWYIGVGGEESLRATKVTNLILYPL